MESAGTEISLGRIARKAGMTKSSLYNYCRSKDELIRDTMIRQARLFEELYLKYLDRFTDYREVLFAHFLFLVMFLHEFPQILNYMQRLHAGGLPLGRSEEDRLPGYMTHMDKGLAEGYLQSRGFPVPRLTALTSLSTVREFLYRNNIELPLEEKVTHSIRLYRLFTGGTTYDRRSMT